MWALRYIKLTCVFKSVLQTSSGFVSAAAAAPAMAPDIKWDLKINIYVSISPLDCFEVYPGI